MFICPHDDDPISLTTTWQPVATVCDLCAGLVCANCGHCQTSVTHMHAWVPEGELPDGSPRSLHWKGSEAAAAAGRALNIGRH